MGLGNGAVSPQTTPKSDVEPQDLEGPQGIVQRHHAPNGYMLVSTLRDYEADGSILLV